MTAASNEVVAVIQADRDEANAIRLLVVSDLEKSGFTVEGKMTDLPDDDRLVQILARHRIAHSDPRPVAEGLREALTHAAKLLETLSRVTRHRTIDPNVPLGRDIIETAERLAALATHSPAPMAGEGASVCQHGIRAPWQCHQCDEANPPPPGYDPLAAEKRS